MDATKTIRLADYDINELDAWLVSETLVEQSHDPKISYPKTSLPKLSYPKISYPKISYPKISYRSRQISKWLGRGIQSFEDMTNLPRELREKLALRSITGIPEIIAETISPRDGTIKFGMKAFDGCIFECVLMRYKHGLSVCVSSQAGCRRGCAFCATKPDSYARDLSPGEMFGQVVAVARHIKSRTIVTRKAPDNKNPVIRNVVIMGIGEPLDNYDNTMKFIRLLHENDETGISYRRITISTCGVLPGILRLADEGLPIGLAVSLHASNDAARSLLMPVNRRYSIDKLIEGCKIYTYKTNRRVTFEYALMNGVNDAPDDAKELLRKVRGMLCHVNLIPVNRAENTVFSPSSNDRIARFCEILSNAGVQNTVRRELGTDIKAACGQLRNSMN